MKCSKGKTNNSLKPMRPNNMSLWQLGCVSKIWTTFQGCNSLLEYKETFKNPTGVHYCQVQHSIDPNLRSPLLLHHLVPRLHVVYHAPHIFGTSQKSLSLDKKTYSYYKILRIYSISNKLTTKCVIVIEQLICPNLCS